MHSVLLLSGKGKKRGGAFWEGKRKGVIAISFGGGKGEKGLAPLLRREGGRPWKRMGRMNAAAPYFAKG